MQVCNDDIGPGHSANSIQVFGLMHGQSLPWHTDGDDEVGDTVALLWLGGAHNWEQVLKLDDDVQAGLMTTEEAEADFLYLTEHVSHPHDPCEPQEIVLPLIHGSVVVFTGREFTKYYEVSFRSMYQLL